MFNFSEYRNKIDYTKILNLFMSATTDTNNEERRKSEDELTKLPNAHLVIGFLTNSQNASLSFPQRTAMVAALKTYQKRLKQDTSLNLEHLKGIVKMFVECISTFDTGQANYLAVDGFTLLDTYYETLAHFVTSLDHKLTTSVCNFILDTYVLSSNLKNLDKFHYNKVLLALMIVVRSVNIEVKNLVNKVKVYLADFHLFISEYDALISTTFSDHTNQDPLNFMQNQNSTIQVQSDQERKYLINYISYMVYNYSALIKKTLQSYTPVQYHDMYEFLKTSQVTSNLYSVLNIDHYMFYLSKQDILKAKRNVFETLIFVLNKSKEFDYAGHPIITLFREVVERVCTQCVPILYETKFWESISSDSYFRELFVTGMMFFAYVLTNKHFTSLLNKDSIEVLAQIVVSLLKETEDDQEKFEFNPVEYAETYSTSLEIPNLYDTHHTFNYDIKNLAFTILYYTSQKLDGFLTFISVFAMDLLEKSLNSNSQECNINASLNLVNFKSNTEQLNLALMIITALKRSIYVARSDLVDQIVDKVRKYLANLFQSNLVIRVKSYFLFMYYFDDILIKSTNDHNLSQLFSSALELILRSSSTDEIENYTKDLVFKYITEFLREDGYYNYSNSKELTDTRVKKRPEVKELIKPYILNILNYVITDHQAIKQNKRMEIITTITVFFPDVLSTQDSNGNMVFEHLLNIIPSILQKQDRNRSDEKDKAMYDPTTSRCFEIVEKIISTKDNMDSNRMVIAFDKYISSLLATRPLSSNVWSELIKHAGTFCQKWKLVSPSIYSMISYLDEYEKINDWRYDEQLKLINNILRWDTSNIAADVGKIELIIKQGIKKMQNKSNWEPAKNELHVNESVIILQYLFMYFKGSNLLDQYLNNILSLVYAELTSTYICTPFLRARLFNLVFMCLSYNRSLTMAYLKNNNLWVNLLEWSGENSQCFKSKYDRSVAVMGYMLLMYEFIFFELTQENQEATCTYFAKILAKTLNILDIQKNLYKNYNDIENEEEMMNNLEDEEMDFDEIDLFNNLGTIDTPVQDLDEFRQLYDFLSNIQGSGKGKEFFDVIYYMLPSASKFKLVELSKFNKFSVKADKGTEENLTLARRRFKGRSVKSGQGNTGALNAGIPNVTNMNPTGYEM